MNKKTIMVTLLLMCLFMLGTVSAADSIDSISDVANDKLSIDTGDEIEISDSQSDELKDNGKTFDELRDEIETAQPGSVITIETDQYTYQNVTPIRVGDNITIDGDDSRFFGTNSSMTGLFKVEGDNVVLKNMVFMNWDLEGSYKIIEWFGNNGTLQNCYFVNNTGVYGCAVDWSGMDGCIDECYFENNAVTNHGGAICIYSLAEGTVVKKSRFINNTAVENGGAIYVNAHGITIEDSKFENCMSVEGGAVYFNSNNNLITVCTFTDCRALNGGAIFVKGDDNNVTSNQYHENFALEKGGAIYIEGKDCYIGEGSYFNANTALEDGGAIYSSTDIIIDTVYCVNNTAETGGAIYAKGEGIITESVFENNNATYAGAILCQDELALKEVSFNGNTADLGGALVVSEDSRITDSAFTNNQALSGGAIAALGNTNVEIENSNFENNTALDGTNNIVLTGDATITADDKTTSDTPLSLKAAEMALEYDDNITYGGTQQLVAYIIHGSEPVNEGIIETNIDGKSYSANVTGGTAVINVTNLTAGEYDAVLIFSALGYVKIPVDYNFTVQKQNANITAKAPSFVINYAKNYSVTVTDAEGSPLGDKNITFKLNGKVVGKVKTGADGVAKVKITSKMLKTAKAGNKNLQISLADDNYNAPAKTVKAKINKEKTKFVAKKKTFKASTKTKKYTVALKNSKGKAVKKAKVTLKVKGKTYKAKTNSKGKATFKITKLSKKGKFKATIKFKANKYYKSATKKVKLTIK